MNLVFDLDGTLTDPKPGISACIRHALEQLGQPLEPEASLDWCIGPPLQDSFAKLLGDAKDVPQALELYRERFRERGMFENSVYPDIPRVLDGLSGRADLFVASSKPRVFVEKIVEHFGLARHFKAVCGSGLDGSHSDKGELIAWLLREQALPKAEVVMVGDREHDMIGAKANGIPGIGVLWGYGSEKELRDAGARATARDPRALEGLLLALL